MSAGHCSRLWNKRGAFEGPHTQHSDCTNWFGAGPDSGCGSKRARWNKCLNHLIGRPFGGSP